MPRVNIYLNEERLAKSKMISNFSEFVGSAIDNYMTAEIKPRGEKTPKIMGAKTNQPTIIKTTTVKKKGFILEAPTVSVAKTIDKEFNFCKHDAVVGFCKNGCK